MPSPQEHFAVSSLVLALPSPLLGAGLGWEAWGKGVGSSSVLGTGAVGEQSYRPGLFWCHQGRGKMGFPSHGGKWSIPEAAPICAKGRVSGGEG